MMETVPAFVEHAKEVLIDQVFDFEVSFWKEHAADDVAIQRGVCETREWTCKGQDRCTD
jgi:hypothetical protein